MWDGNRKLEKEKSASSVSKYILGTIAFPCYHPLRQIYQLCHSSQLTEDIPRILLWMLAGHCSPATFGQKPCDTAQTSLIHAGLVHSLNLKHWFEYFSELTLGYFSVFSIFTKGIPFLGLFYIIKT